jgi:hypothetical protein
MATPDPQERKALTANQLTEIRATMERMQQDPEFLALIEGFTRHLPLREVAEVEQRVEEPGKGSEPQTFGWAAGVTPAAPKHAAAAAVGAAAAAAA